MTFARIALVALCAATGFHLVPANATGQLLGRETPTQGPDVRGTAMHVLAIRNGPGKQYRKLGEFPKGSQLVFLSPPGCMNGYCAVQGPRGQRGWILAEAVRKNPNTGAGKASRSDVAGYAISANKLNLRSGPSKYDNVLAIVPVGEVMHLLKSPPCRNDYCYIETQRGKRGWVLRSAISVHGF